MDAKRKRIVVASVAFAAVLLCALGAFLAWYLACPTSPGYLHRAKAQKPAPTATHQVTHMQTAAQTQARHTISAGGKPPAKPSSAFSSFSSIASSIGRTGSSAITAIGSAVGMSAGPPAKPAAVTNSPTGILSTEARKKRRKALGLRVRIDETQNKTTFFDRPQSPGPAADAHSAKKRSVFDDDNEDIMDVSLPSEDEEEYRDMSTVVRRVTTRQSRQTTDRPVRMTGVTTFDDMNGQTIDDAALAALMDHLALQENW